MELHFLTEVGFSTNMTFMIKLHPLILKKDGKSEFVILPYEEYLALQERMEDAVDLADLKEAIQQEDDAPTISLKALKMGLTIA